MGTPMNFHDRISGHLGNVAVGRSFTAQAMTGGQKTWHIFEIAVLNFLRNNDLLWASALTYTVALSIVPILALAFSVLKALGGIEHIRPIIDRYVALGSPQVSGYLMHFISNVNAATLGSVGGAALLLTVISTLGTVERAFNTIWEVPEGRSHLRKFTDYLSIVFTAIRWSPTESGS
jgi:membrane protein